ncbi:MAG: PadR family transcriptional regulator [Acidimicrobiales bacterium]
METYSNGKRPDRHDGHRPDVCGVTPRNFLRACLLLLIRERPDYGYDLIERLCDFGIDHEDPGAVYRTLRWLEHDGEVVSGWADSSSGPSRRTYTLTDQGHQALGDYSRALDECRRTVESFLDRYLDAVDPVPAAPKRPAGSR